MRNRNRQSGFTLIELLVVISIIALLVSILLPSLQTAKELARSTQCLSNLRSCGIGMSIYHSQNDGYFWPVSMGNYPEPGMTTYFWGTKDDPVDASVSPFMNCLNDNLQYLWCPSFRWGDYVPQGSVSEPTTTYGYNAYYLSPKPGETIRAEDIPSPSELFVLADTAMKWAPAGVSITQNSTYLEHVEGTWVQTPTNHFRHVGRTNALCADGHAESFSPEGWDVDPQSNLGFVGTENDPHYEQ